MKKSEINYPEVIQFLRQKDFLFKKELGQGSCGKTILVHDEVIQENFVCKKYQPFSEQFRDQLFLKFIEEIKLLHLVYHENLVRIFNYYIYDDQKTGYILMEEVKGLEIHEFIEANPSTINDVFAQVINAFAYLESHGILHRDIRPQNLMVTTDGIVKVIDFGFGKAVQNTEDFDKSISLNWWCDTPEEFQQKTYDFKTEIYFIGKLFEQLITDNKIETFQPIDLLREMCTFEANKRASSFSKINEALLSKKFKEIEFTDSEISAYRNFSDHLVQFITKIEDKSTLRDDVNEILQKLSSLHKRVMLEEMVPTPNDVSGVFIIGLYYSKINYSFDVSDLKNFLNLMRASNNERRLLVLNNIHSKLDSIAKYTKDTNFDLDDEIPF